MDKRIEQVIVGSIQTNCWLYLLDNEPNGKQPCVVIDPGDNAPKITASLQSLGWIPRYILLTHGHWDHVTALPDMLEAFAKNAFGSKELPEVYIHRLDANRLKKDDNPIHHFEDGDTIGPFKVLHTPGHTQGSCCFYDEKKRVLFSGDTLFEGDHGRTDLPGGDAEQMRKSLKRLVSLDEKTVVYPGHDITTTIAAEKHKYW